MPMCNYLSCVEDNHGVLSRDILGKLVPEMSRAAFNDFTIDKSVNYAFN